jgi:hypothetical protein
MTLVPAYGRDYKSKKEVLSDYNAGKDFLVSDFFSPFDGKPANKNDLAGERRIFIRYKKLTQICIVPYKGE